MLCERCQRREATLHLSQIVEGMPGRQVHLCEPCAIAMGGRAPGGPAGDPGPPPAPPSV